VDEVGEVHRVEPRSLERATAIINRYPDRFLFGTDEVARGTQKGYLKVYEMSRRCFREAHPEASEKLRTGTTSGSSTPRG